MFKQSEFYPGAEIDALVAADTFSETTSQTVEYWRRKGFRVEATHSAGHKQIIIRDQTGKTVADMSLFINSPSIRHAE